MSSEVGNVDTEVALWSKKNNKVGYYDKAKKMLIASTSNTTPTVKKIIKCYRCRKNGHYKNQCPELKEKQINAFSAAFFNSEFSTEDWYIDSGASAHMTSNKERLLRVRKVHDTKEIIVANKMSVPVLCAGDTQITTKALLTELTGVEELSRRTLFCARCGHRLLIDKKHSGVDYCTCNNGNQQPESLDGWVPYMEAEDVIIWRKEYKRGQGLYAYKVYGRYGEVRAADFAAVQVDGAYRREWDAAVASLSVVERRANGLHDQAVLHWEVLWPRLFANRDYVYIRRHKEYDIKSSLQPSQLHKEGLFSPPAGTGSNDKHHYEERPSVHSNAKRKAMEAYSAQNKDNVAKDNKVYVIISRSCEHPKVPVSKHAIRVSEYWSHMVIKTLDGPDKTGMEFVLTYYDEPAVGGLPHGVATWATGRAAPAYLQRMRTAATHYATARTHRHEDLPDFTPFVPKHMSNEADEKSSDVSEEEMESSKQGPELNGNHKQPAVSTRDQSTQTDHEPASPSPPAPPAPRPSPPAPPTDSGVHTDGYTAQMDPAPTLEADSKPSEENNGSWWRYLYPFYYFV